MLAALATVFLRLLGAAGESIGMDRVYKANSSRTRTHSLFNQARMSFESLETMRAERALPLLKAFEEQVQANQTLLTILGVL